jgi:hypothetical protein
LVIGPILSLHRINGAFAVVGAENLPEIPQMQAIRFKNVQENSRIAEGDLQQT